MSMKKTIIFISFLLMLTFSSAYSMGKKPINFCTKSLVEYGNCVTLIKGVTSTKCEVGVITDYTHALYTTLNAHLRGYAPADDCEAIAIVLDRALLKLEPVVKQSVYRLAQPTGLVATTPVGACFRELGYLSTSSNSDVKPLVNRSKDDLTLTIDGVSGKSIAQYSKFQFEQEVLFPRNAVFQKENQNGAHISLKEVVAPYYECANAKELIAVD